MRRVLPPASRLRPALVGTAVTAVALVGGMVAVGAFGTPNAGRTYVVFLVNVMLVVSIQLFTGNSGIVTFGHVAFMGIGAYATALLTMPESTKLSQLPDLPASVASAELGLLPAVLIAAVLAAVVAAVLGGGLIRMTESTMAMATLALLVVAHTVFQNWNTFTRGSLGLAGIPVRTTTAIGTVAAIVFVMLGRLYKESGAGLRVRASREDPLSAASGGTNVVRSRYGAWILSAGMMGAAGSLWAQSVIAFNANQFYFAVTFALLAMVVIGGRASVTGAVAGAAIVTFLSDTLSQVEQGVRIGPIELPRITGTVQFAIALLIIVTLIWRPEGLLDRWELDDILRRFTRAGRRARGGESTPGATGKEQGDAAPAVPSPTDLPLARPVLVVRDVAKHFEGLTALADVDLEIREGEILGLIGPNGSGKTTLLNVISGVYAPSAGEIVFLDLPIGGHRAHEIADRGIARTFQNIRLFSELTVRENVEAMAQRGTGTDAVDEVLAWFDLTEVQREKATNLPYGRQRRLEIARAVVRRPSLVLLDEPAAGMNESESDDLLQNIRRIRTDLGSSVLVVDHDLRLIMQLCDRIQVLDQGRTIAIGTPQETAGNPVVIEAYLGGSSARSA